MVRSCDGADEFRVDHLVERGCVPSRWRRAVTSRTWSWSWTPHGPPQYLVVPPQFGVIAAGAGRMFAYRVSHRDPFTTVGSPRRCGQPASTTMAPRHSASWRRLPRRRPAESAERHAEAVVRKAGGSLVRRCGRLGLGQLAGTLDGACGRPSLPELCPACRVVCPVPSNIRTLVSWTTHLAQSPERAAHQHWPGGKLW